MKCDCCGYKPTPADKVMRRLKKFRNGSSLGSPGPVGIATIKGDCPETDINVCLMCWGEIMKRFGRMVRESYVTLPFHTAAASIIAAIKEKK